MTLNDNYVFFRFVAQALVLIQVVFCIYLCTSKQYWKKLGSRFIKVVQIYNITIGSVLTCDAHYVLNNRARIEFTNSFCWSSSSSVNRVCKDLLPIDNSTALLQEHETAKYFYQLFPYLLIAQVSLC